MTILNMSGEAGVIVMPVPPLMAREKLLPNGFRVDPGDISLSFILDSGLRVAVRNRQVQASAAYATEMQSGPLAVQCLPLGDEEWDQDDFMSVDSWVRCLHADASRLLLESFCQFEEAVLAHGRGASLHTPPGWDSLELTVYEPNPYRGFRTVVALAVSEYMNQHCARE